MHPVICGDVDVLAGWSTSWALGFQRDLLPRGSNPVLSVSCCWAYFCPSCAWGVSLQLVWVVQISVQFSQLFLCWFESVLCVCHSSVRPISVRVSTENVGILSWAFSTPRSYPQTPQLAEPLYLQTDRQVSLWVELPVLLCSCATGAHLWGKIIWEENKAGTSPCVGCLSKY